MAPNFGPVVDRMASAVARRLLAPLWRLEIRARGVALGERSTIDGRPIVVLERGSSVTIGRSVSLLSRSRSTALGVSRPVILRTLRSDAKINIGDDTGLSGATICAAGTVSIGSRVLVGADVLITDTDFHPVDSIPRRYAPAPLASPNDAVQIGDDVFLGARTVVLPGVSIGAGTVVGAASVVTTDLPAGVVAAGNPCRVIRQLRSE